MALTNKLRAIGNAIRAKTGKTDELTLDQMVTEIAGIAGIEGEGGNLTEYSEAEDAIISGTISSYTNSRVTSVGQGAFAFASTLTTVSFPAVTTIGRSAFQSCTSLTAASFPALIAFSPVSINPL